MSVSDRTPRMITRAPTLADELHGQAVELSHVDVAEFLGHLADQLDTLIAREQRLLVDIEADADDQFVDEPAAPLDHVEMAQRDRIERAGVDCAARHGGLMAKRILGYGLQGFHQSIEVLFIVVCVGTDSQPAGPATEDDLAGKAVLFRGQRIAAGELERHDSRTLLAAAMLRPTVGNDGRRRFRAAVRMPDP